MVLVESGFSNIKDIELPILASGLPDTMKHFLTTIFTCQYLTYGNIHIENTS
jgi:hypothetical protein